MSAQPSKDESKSCEVFNILVDMVESAQDHSNEEKSTAELWIRLFDEARKRREEQSTKEGTKQ